MIQDPLRPGLISEDRALEFNRQLAHERKRRETSENLRRKDLTNDAMAMQRERWNHLRREALFYFLIAALWLYNAASTYRAWMLFAVLGFGTCGVDALRKARACKRDLDYLRRTTSSE